MHDKIVVKPIVRQKSAIIEVIMDERDNMGTVVAVGPGRNGRTLFKAGDNERNNFL